MWDFSGFGNSFCKFRDRDIYGNGYGDRDDYANWIYYLRACSENYDERRSHRYDIRWTRLDAWRA